VNASNLTEKIFTDRFSLRPLKMDDVVERYARWLSDQATSKYISATLSLSELRQYVQERCDRDNSELRYAIMGILIGEAEWRGKGVAAEVLSASADWLHRYRNIEQIVLGVSRSNVAAIRAYQKAGFVEQSTVYIPNVSAENSTMVLHLKSL
jgi:RimJ/RimL family protein N-acetyltransferase